MKTIAGGIVRIRASREAVAILGMSAVLAGSAFADVKYTEVTSVDQGGKLVPMTTSTTFLKDGLERVDMKQDLGMYKMEETTIRNAARKETVTVDYKLKLYAVDSVDGNGGAGGAGATQTSAGNGTKGTGKIVWSADVDFLGKEKLADYETRHYKMTQSMDSSGCCGTSKTNFKQEVWMADVKLPVFNAGGDAPDWQRSYNNGGKNECKITFERKGDTKAYDEAMRGLALKTIMFNDQTGKPMSSREITLLVFPKLEDSEFAVPAGFKKVSKEEYQQARSKAMMAAMTAPRNNRGNGDDEPAANQQDVPVNTNTKPVDGGDIAENAAKEVAKQKARKKFKLPF